MYILNVWDLSEYRIHLHVFELTKSGSASEVVEIEKLHKDICGMACV